jgi:hypothetical protein
VTSSEGHRRVREPVQPLRVVCRRCGQVPWEGDQPSDDARQLLADFADSSCPIGGTASGCPSTTESQATTDEQEPSRLRQIVKAIRDRAPRGMWLQLPDLAANTPKEVTVTWTPAMPDSSYTVTALPVHGAALLTAGIRAVVKPGSLTTADCVLIVAATQAVSAGQAGLHVSAVP